jgi:hypothetical protein
LEASHKQTLSLVDKEYKEKVQDFTFKMDRLQEENRSLKSSTTTEWVKITRPDGTIEERRVSKKEMEALSQTVVRLHEESQQKIKEETEKVIEEKRKEVSIISERYSLEIASLKTSVSEKEEVIKTLKETSKVTTINERHLSVGVGIDTDLSYSGSVSYSIFGPFWLGGRLDVTPTWSIPRGAVMLGVSF